MQDKVSLPLVVLPLAKTHLVNQNVSGDLFEPFLHFQITKRMLKEKQNNTSSSYASHSKRTNQSAGFILMAEQCIQSDVGRGSDG